MECFIIGIVFNYVAEIVFSFNPPIVRLKFAHLSTFIAETLVYVFLHKLLNKLKSIDLKFKFVYFTLEFLGLEKNSL